METAIQKLLPDAADENEFYIKRDDLLPFSMGGNKVRIAEAFFADMLRQGKNYMILYGSRHSNLCRVLSNLCFCRGVSCCMVCSHDGEEDEGTTNNTRLIAWTGTQMYHCQKSEIAQTVERAMEDARAAGKRPYYIYGNKYGQGNEGTAAAAYAKAYGEIQAFEKNRNMTFEYLFCPNGTGATQAGLICGHLQAGDEKKIMGVLISSREPERAKRVTAESVQGYFEKNALTLPDGYLAEVHILDGYRLNGYEDYDAEVEACIRREYCCNSIPLDPVYTAKAFLGMKKYLRENHISGKRILFLHTGGTPLFYDYLANTLR